MAAECFHMFVYDHALAGLPGVLSVPVGGGALRCGTVQQPACCVLTLGAQI